MFVELYLPGKDQSMQRSCMRNDFVSLLKTLGPSSDTKDVLGSSLLEAR